MNKELDSIQQRVTEYASALTYANLSPEAIHSAKLRTIDTLGVLIGGFFGAPARSARNVAMKMPNPDGATIFGTRVKTTPDMAAFVNGTTARAAEFNDVYHWPGSSHGQPSDVLMPVLAVAEHARRSGRDFILAVVLGYEIYTRFCDAMHGPALHNSNFCTLGVSVAAGKLLDLTPEQLSHCLSMAVVPNVIQGYDRLPREHRARVTVDMNNGEQWVAESGGDIDDLSVQKNDAQVDAKFREMTEDLLGTKRVTSILDRLWHLEHST